MLLFLPTCIISNFYYIRRYIRMPGNRMWGLLPTWRYFGDHITIFLDWYIKHLYTIRRNSCTSLLRVPMLSRLKFEKMTHVSGSLINIVINPLNRDKRNTSALETFAPKIKTAGRETWLQYDYKFKACMKSLYYFKNYVFVIPSFKPQNSSSTLLKEWKI